MLERYLEKPDVKVLVSKAVSPICPDMERYYEHAAKNDLIVEVQNPVVGVLFLIGDRVDCVMHRPEKVHMKKYGNRNAIIEDPIFGQFVATPAFESLGVEFPVNFLLARKLRLTESTPELFNYLSANHISLGSLDEARCVVEGTLWDSAMIPFEEEAIYGETYEKFSLQGAFTYNSASILDSI